MNYKLLNNETVSLSYQDLPHIILSVLYSLREHSTGFISLGEIVRFTAKEWTASELHETAGYLEAKGYAKAKYVLGGVFVRLTTSGIVYVEDTIKNDSSVVNTVATDIYKKLGSDVSRLVETEENLLKLRIPLHDTLKKIEQVLKDRIGTQTPLLLDAQIMDLELQKPEPDPDVLTAKIMALENVRLGPVMAQFKDQLGMELSSPHVIDGGVF